MGILTFFLCCYFCSHFLNAVWRRCSYHLVLSNLGTMSGQEESILVQRMLKLKVHQNRMAALAKVRSKAISRTNRKLAHHYFEYLLARRRFLCNAQRLQMMSVGLHLAIKGLEYRSDHIVLSFLSSSYTLYMLLLLHIKSVAAPNILHSIIPTIQHSCLQHLTTIPNSQHLKIWVTNSLNTMSRPTITMLDLTRKTFLTGLYPPILLLDYVKCLPAQALW